MKNNIIAYGDFGIYFLGSYSLDITEYVSQYLTISYNDVWQNSSDNYFATLSSPPLQNSGVFDPISGTGEIHYDPLFIDPEHGDFQLLSDSPCIDSSDPDSPSIRWGGFYRDMGAFEYDQGFYFDGQNIVKKPDFPIPIGEIFF